MGCATAMLILTELYNEVVLIYKTISFSQFKTLFRSYESRHL